MPVTLPPVMHFLYNRIPAGIDQYGIAFIDGICAVTDFVDSVPGNPFYGHEYLAAAGQTIK
ncbi:MAG: hypothetical protein K2G67_05475 [Muribaculaceae bacterium]|nr:hypothetical protein [Muribaculaceae bacterium]